MSKRGEDLYLDLASTISLYATCGKLMVGCVLVNDERIVSLGYNGAPRGLPHCTDVGCDLMDVNGRPSCKRSVHAEANALLNAAYVGASTKGATLYVTHSPCYDCAKLLINAGVELVVFKKVYEDDRSKELWNQVYNHTEGRGYARKRF